MPAADHAQPPATRRPAPAAALVPGLVQRPTGRRRVALPTDKRPATPRLGRSRRYSSSARSRPGVANACSASAESRRGVTRALRPVRIAGPAMRRQRITCQGRTGQDMIRPGITGQRAHRQIVGHQNSLEADPATDNPLNNGRRQRRRQAWIPGRIQNVRRHAPSRQVMAFKANGTKSASRSFGRWATVGNAR